MAGGVWIGLGQGLQQAGKYAADARLEAINRVFREREMKLREQEQLDRQKADQEKMAQWMIENQPQGSPVDVNMAGPGGVPLLTQFSKPGRYADPNSPLAGAHSVAGFGGGPPAAGAGADFGTGPEVQNPLQDYSTVRPQNLSPQINGRVSIPTENTRYRSAEMSAYQRAQGLQLRARLGDERNRIADASVKLRERIANTQDQNEKRRLTQYDLALQQRREMIDARIADMQYDDELAGLRYENPLQGSGGSGNLFQQILMQNPELMGELLGGGGGSLPTPAPGATAGAAGAVPGASPTPTKPPRVAPPVPDLKHPGRRRVGPSPDEVDGGDDPAGLKPYLPKK